MLTSRDFFGSRFSSGIARGAAPAGGSGGCPPRITFSSFARFAAGETRKRRGIEDASSKKSLLERPPLGQPAARRQKGAECAGGYYLTGIGFFGAASEAGWKGDPRKSLFLRSPRHPLLSRHKKRRRGASFSTTGTPVRLLQV